MTADIDMFKQGMRTLVGGVTAITTMHEGRPYGLTATAVCSVSAQPPRLLACVNCGGETYPAIQKSRIICVNILSTDHEELAKRFAGMSDLAGADRFQGDDWTSGVTGAPILKNALAAFDCSVPAIMDTGSHGIVIADVQRIEMSARGKPLLYANGQFVTIENS